jgi:translation elongation factor EF-4
LLVVDASQGVQAQTIANFFLAFEANLNIIPIINKIDLKSAKVKETIEQMKQILDLKEDEMICISAKTGLNCSMILEEIIKRISP